MCVCMHMLLDVHVCVNVYRTVLFTCTGYPPLVCVVYGCVFVYMGVYLRFSFKFDCKFDCKKEVELQYIVQLPIRFNCGGCGYPVCVHVCV